jgi:PAS domain S-box-containing protein
VLKSVAQPVWVVDPSGSIRFANPAAIDALGYDDLVELLGQPSHETIHYRRPDGSPFPASECPMLLPRLTGEAVSSEHDWFIRRDGSMVPVSYASAPIDMPDGRGAVVAFTDITERVQAERVLRERDAILASVRQPVWMIDPEGRIRFANPAALAVLGYDSLAELEGRPGHTTVHHTRRDGSPYPIGECPLAKCRIQGATIEVGEEDWIRRDGSFVRIEYSCAPVDSPSGPGMVVAFTDVDERRQLEAALRERDHAEARAAELRATSQRIVATADAARRQVTRDLHDGAQQRFVSVLINLQLGLSTWDDDPPKARQLFDAALVDARSGLDELRELVSGIHPSILVNRGLRSAVEELVRRAPVHVDLHSDIARRLPETVEVTAYFFVSEALTNAVKHAEASQVRVTLALGPDALVVDVADNGVGGATLDAASGTGLGGLADRVAALGGLLDLTSQPGEGTTLHAGIPLITDRSQPKPRPPLIRADGPSADAADTGGRSHHMAPVIGET